MEKYVLILINLFLLLLKFLIFFLKFLFLLVTCQLFRIIKEEEEEKRTTNILIIKKFAVVERDFKKFAVIGIEL